MMYQFEFRLMAARAFRTIKIYHCTRPKSVGRPGSSPLKCWSQFAIRCDPSPRRRLRNPLPLLPLQNGLLFGGKITLQKQKKNGANNCTFGGFTWLASQINIRSHFASDDRLKCPFRGPMISVGDVSFWEPPPRPIIENKAWDVWFGKVVGGPSA